MTIIECVLLLEHGARVVEHSIADPCVQWALFALADGRRLLFVERTYREGSTVILDPTEEELAACRADPWTAWHSPRAEDDAILRPGEA